MFFGFHIFFRPRKLKSRFLEGNPKIPGEKSWKNSMKIIYLKKLEKFRWNFIWKNLKNFDENLFEKSWKKINEIYLKKVEKIQWKFIWKKLKKNQWKSMKIYLKKVEKK